MPPTLSDRTLKLLEQVCDDYGENPEVLGHWSTIIPTLLDDLLYYKRRCASLPEDDTDE